MSRKSPSRIQVIYRDLFSFRLEPDCQGEDWRTLFEPAVKGVMQLPTPALDFLLLQRFPPVAGQGSCEPADGWITPQDLPIFRRFQDPLRRSIREGIVQIDGIHGQNLGPNDDVMSHLNSLEIYMYLYKPASGDWRREIFRTLLERRLWEISQRGNIFDAYDGVHQVAYNCRAVTQFIVAQSTLFRDPVLIPTEPQRHPLITAHVREELLFRAIELRFLCKFSPLGPRPRRRPLLAMLELLRIRDWPYATDEDRSKELSSAFYCLDINARMWIIILATFMEPRLRSIHSEMVQKFQILFPNDPDECHCSDLSAHITGLLDQYKNELARAQKLASAPSSHESEIGA